MNEFAATIGQSQPPMRKMRNLKSKMAVTAVLMACQPFQTSNANDLFVNLDALNYRLHDLVQINLNTGTFTINSGMRNCQRPNGAPPALTEPTTLVTSTQTMGLENFSYQIGSGSLIFYSETGDLSCLNAFGTDVIFSHGLEWASSPIFFYGFE